MMDILWDQKYEIGHTRIDFEHRIFLDLIRGIAADVGRVSDARRLSRQLNELGKYAEFHFVSEENIMIDVGFPGLEEQRGLHTELLLALREMSNRVMAGKVGSEDLVSFLVNWFVHHTTEKDVEIARYIESGGAASAA